MRKIFLSIVLIAGMFSLLAMAGIPTGVSAYTKEMIPNVWVDNDYTVGPAENELFLEPGQRMIRELLITSRLGRDMGFRITVEDFKGSPEGETSVKLLGADKGPYSLKDYVKPEISEFTLKHGERMVLPIMINIPADVEPGGRYGAVLVSTFPIGGEPEGDEGARSVVRVIGRVAALYLVRVQGEVIEDGYLEDFRLASGKRFYDKGPISFELLFRNKGNVHLNIYGLIEIKNVVGSKVGEISLVQPWFAMPDSLRSRVVSWNRNLLFGHYTATAKINRGYQDIIDEKSVSFWVVPWKTLVPFAAVLVGLIVSLVWLFNKFDLIIKRK